MMSQRQVLFCWICLNVFMSGCGTASQEDKNNRPKAQVIGHGTTPGSSWAGVGVTIPFPSKSTKPSPSSSVQDSNESGKP